MRDAPSNPSQMTSPELFAFLPSAGEECFILIDPDTGFFSEHHDGYSATEELLRKAAQLSPSAKLLEKSPAGWSPC
jgi:hypothetical protein